MYLHNETYKTYLLFAKMRNGNLFFDPKNPWITSKFDEKLYFSKDKYSTITSEQSNDENYFPVSVMVVEENFGIPTPDRCWCPDEKKYHSGGRIVRKTNRVRTFQQPRKQHEDNCVIIRLMATKDRFRKKGYGSVLLAKYLEHCKVQHKKVDYVYAITRFNPQYYKEREDGFLPYHMTRDLSEDMEKYYDDYQQPPSWSDYDRVMDVRTDLVPCEDDEDVVYTNLTAYEDMNEGYVAMLTKFGFVCASPYNDCYNNDQDNRLNLNYAGHVMVLKFDLGRNYSGLSKLLKKSSSLNDGGQSYPVVNFSNMAVENLRYIKKYHDYSPDVHDEITFDEMYENGHFETFNHMWHWTIVKKETLMNDASFVNVAKACVMSCKF